MQSEAYQRRIATCHLYVCVHVSVCVCMFFFVCVSSCVCSCVCVCVCVCDISCVYLSHENIHTCDLCVCVCVCVNVHVCNYVYVHVCVFIVCCSCVCVCVCAQMHMYYSITSAVCTSTVRTHTCPFITSRTVKSSRRVTISVGGKIIIGLTCKNDIYQFHLPSKISTLQGK